MILYRSHRPMSVPKTPEARLEIMKAISTLMSQEAAQKFDPNQPRVPAGNPDGGQWTGEDGQGSGQGASRLAARRISPALLAECEEQYERDLEECRRVGL